MNTKEQIIATVRNAGIIGAGGGGFPTHVKLQANVDTIVANGSECEPLLSSDRTMMTKTPHLLIEGMQIAMRATGATRGIIGVKAHYEDAVQALLNVLPNDGSITLHLLDNYYPAGDEFLLLYETTGRVIPEGGIPLHVGAVVSNVITFMQIAEAMSGKPVVERTVTLAGEFNEPKIVTVPVGTTYEKLIQLAGGLKRNDVTLIDGGPMMGKIVDDVSAGIKKTTSGLLALPNENFIIRQMKKSLSQMIKLSKSACCQCYRCTDLCPRNLIGHDLFPHMTMRTIDYNMDVPKEHITSAFLCSQCGMCELVACDFMLLSPRQIYAAYRQALVKKGVKNPHQKKPARVLESFDDRKVSIPMVMKKLGISDYNVVMPFVGKTSTHLVKIKLNGHAGAPATPLVSVGQRVKMCDKIAETDSTKLGAVYHASIDGVVTEITNDYIEIQS